MLCTCCVAIIAILYILFDVNYFLRMVFVLLWGRLFEKKKKLLDTRTIYGICSIQDIDLLWRDMTNARYLRELDFARFYFYDNSGIYSTIVKRGGSAHQSASNIRYRRSIFLFTVYKITTKLIYWDDKCLYIEHQFVNLADNFIHAVVLSRQITTDLKVPIEDIIAEIEPETRKPEPTKELQLWLELMEESSRNLKKQK